MANVCFERVSEHRVGRLRRPHGVLSAAAAERQKEIKRHEHSIRSKTEIKIHFCPLRGAVNHSGGPRDRKVRVPRAGLEIS